MGRILNYAVNIDSHNSPITCHPTHVNVHHSAGYGALSARETILSNAHAAATSPIYSKYTLQQKIIKSQIGITLRSSLFVSPLPNRKK